MKRFARLYQRLDETNKTTDKVRAIVDYFADVPKPDAAYVLYFLMGHKLKPSLPTKFIRKAASISAGVPDWLFEETYQWVGDLAETAAAMAVGSASPCDEPLSVTLEHRVIPFLQSARSVGKSGGGLNPRKSKKDPDRQLVREQNEDRLVNELIEFWGGYDFLERFVFNKLLTGNLRVGVSEKLVIRALSQWSGLEIDELSHRLMGNWEPTETFLNQLIAKEFSGQTPAKPYPFCLAHPLPESHVRDHAASDYLAEWKWDGIRAQLVRRSGTTFLWSRGEEMLEGRFPEIEQASNRLADGLVLDGEILAFGKTGSLPFTLLQKRIQRKKPSVKTLADIPVVFVAFDVLEHAALDIRSEPFQVRRSILESLGLGDHATSEVIKCSQVFGFENWQSMFLQRDQARMHGAEGLMLKHRLGKYEVGRVTGTWWKSKVTPYTVDAVLVYAQRGHGRRAGVFSDYTFGLWDSGRLVPFAKAYSGLTNEELAKVDRWIKENTTQRFGPVHEVPPVLVMELAFENLQVSNRHKSGIAVRFPRILRWRHDKRPEEADQLDQIKKMLANQDSLDPSRS